MEKKLTPASLILSNLGVMYSLIPTSAPSSVTPLISNMNSTMYGNSAVNHTTYNIIIFKHPTYLTHKRYSSVLIFAIFAS